MTVSNRRAAQVAVAICFVLGLVAARTARADESEPHRLVVVLRPNPASLETWPEGTQAVVAELVAGGYELMLRASRARDRDGLLAELRAVASERPVLGAVVVVRDGDRGIAYVYTAKSGTVPVETGVAEGAVGEGALALRITQILGPPRLEVASPPRAVAPPPPVPPPTPPVVRETERPAFLVAIAGALAFTSDLPEPLPMVGISARRRLVGPLSLEALGAITLGASQLETAGGSVEVSAEELTLHVTFDPFRQAEVGLSLGLGGGVVWVRGEGDPSAGFSATTDATRVGLLSARAAASFTHKDWSLLLGVEPGVMLPAVSIGGGSDTARLGRPWTTASVGLGWNF
jgi:hypothetical protein